MGNSEKINKKLWILAVFVFLAVPVAVIAGEGVMSGSLYFHVRDKIADIDDGAAKQISNLKREQDAANSIKSGKPADEIKVVKHARPATVTVFTGEGQGSGFLISSDGYILTNAHVVKNNKVVLIIFANGLQVFADVLKVRQELDIALLRTQMGKNYPYLKLGNSDKCSDGETVIAIGSPKGLEGTATKGIISAVRKIPGINLTIIQTDTAVNPGNSGGPLVNLKGEVIGITTAKEGIRTLQDLKVGIEGLNYAVSINDAKRIWSE